MSDPDHLQRRMRELERRLEEETMWRREEAEQLVRGTTLLEYLRYCHSLVFKTLQIDHKSVTSTGFAMKVDGKYYPM